MIDGYRHFLADKGLDSIRFCDIGMAEKNTDQQSNSSMSANLSLGCFNKHVGSFVILKKRCRRTKMSFECHTSNFEALSGKFHAHLHL